MKLEMRSAGATEPAQTSPQSTAPAKKERAHILSYILILFIAAFFLMALSFLSHQRSNELVLGQLSTNFDALENLQNALEENIRLQNQIQLQNTQLEALEKELESVKDSLKTAGSEKDALQKHLDEVQGQLTALKNQIAALDALSRVQQLYISGDMDACRTAISDMEAAGLDKLLPQNAAAEGTAPSQLFQQLKTLVPPAETQPAA